MEFTFHTLCIHEIAINFAFPTKQQPTASTATTLPKNHTWQTAQHSHTHAIFAINMDEQQHKKQQQQRNQRPKTKTFPRFFSSFCFSLEMRFFFCFCSVPNSMFKAHPTLIAETTCMLCTPKMASAKNGRKFNYHRQFHLPCGVYGNYGRQEHSRTENRVEQAIVLTLTSTDIHTCLLAQSYKMK